MGHINTPDEERAAIAESARRATEARRPKDPAPCPPHAWFRQSGDASAAVIVLHCHGSCGQRREVDRGTWDLALAGGADPVVDVARARVEAKMEMPVKAGDKAWAS